MRNRHGSGTLSGPLDQDIALRDTVVVITGASSGFGSSTARKLAKAGAAVVLAARREDLLDELVAECRSLGGRALAVPTDVCNEEEVEQLARQAVGIFGRIDVWINNAGVAAVGPFHDIPLADHVQVIETDLLGTLYGSYAAYRQFRRQRRGTLINVASELGRTSAPYYASYTAAKHGVIGLSTALRQEILLDDLLRDNVHVCVVMPSAHDTPFFDHVANFSGHQVATAPPSHDPTRLVDLLIRLIANPHDEALVGTDGCLIFPDNGHVREPAEKSAARQVHKSKAEKPLPSTPDTGVARQPMHRRPRVSGTRREQQKH